MENLLALDILQPAIQVLNLLDNILNLALVLTLNRARHPDCQVKRQFHASETLPAEPARMACAVRRGEANLVVAGISGCEGELAG